MRLCISRVVLLVFLAASLSYGQASGDSDVRKLFMSTRGSGSMFGKMARGRPKPVNNLGLGYTLLLRDERGNFVHASAKRMFKNGDAIRLLVECSNDGYLYVFHQGGNGPVRMIYPNWKVEQGKNRILAHVPLLVPAGAELVIGDNPGTETLTLLVLLRPIENLPTGEGLRGKDNVIVPEDLFQRLSKPTQLRKDERVPDGAPIAIDRSKSDRGPGLRLRTYDEAPDYIVLNHDPIETRLVASVAVVHK